MSLKTGHAAFFLCNYILLVSIFMYQNNGYIYLSENQSAVKVRSELQKTIIGLRNYCQEFNLGFKIACVLSKIRVDPYY